MFGYLIDGVLGVLYLFVAMRLSRLSRRTLETPEWILSGVFLLWSGAYLVWSAYWIVELELEGLAWLKTPYAFLGTGLDILASTATAIFLRSVFRARDQWALWIVIADFALLCVGFGGCYARGDIWIGGVASNPFYYLYFAGCILPMVWMALEGFSQFGRARKRERLGLCGPVVRSRYLLIALASSFWIAYYLIVLTGDVLNEIGAGEPWANTLAWSMAAAEVGAVSMFWLVFLPPQAYRRWLDDSSQFVPGGQG